MSAGIPDDEAFQVDFDECGGVLVVLVNGHGKEGHVDTRVALTGEIEWVVSVTGEHGKEFG